LLLQDACVLINLLASGRCEDIARGCGYQLVVASAVCAETLYIRDASSGDLVKIDQEPQLSSGVLEKTDLETEDERAAYIAYATQLDDGEAMSLAIAEARHLPLATDDRKTHALITREKIAATLTSTPGVVQQWEQISSIPNAEIAAVLDISANAQGTFLELAAVIAAGGTRILKVKLILLWRISFLTFRDCRRLEMGSMPSWKYGEPDDPLPDQEPPDGPSSVRRGLPRACHAIAASPAPRPPESRERFFGLSKRICG
jgi:predicted nucleic acid-binding protein